MDALVRMHLALVKYVVRRYLNRGREYDDLYQMGCLGLVKAIHTNFDTSFDVRFSTYAVPVILGEIRRFLRRRRAGPGLPIHQGKRGPGLPLREITRPASPGNRRWTRSPLRSNCPGRTR